MTVSKKASSVSSSSTSTIVAPSALNVYQKIAVVRNIDDNLHYEVNGAVRTVSVQALGDVISTATPLIVPRPKLEIPVPHLTANETYHRDVPANYDLPRSYVRYHRVTPEEYIDRVDYVADEEDEQWLRANVKFGAAAAVQTLAARPEEADKDVKDADGDKERSVVESLTLPFHRPPQLSIKLFERMLDILEKKTGFDSIVTLQQAEQLLLDKITELSRIFPSQVPRTRLPGSAPPVTVKTVIQDVYNYWFQKRSKLKRPLLRNYWPVTSTEDTNPHLVFRPREKEKYHLRKKRQNDNDAYQKLQQLRNDFDSLRTVLILVKRREELKRTQAQLHIDVFQQRLYDLVDTSGRPRSSVSSKPEVKRELDISALMDSLRRQNKKTKNAGSVADRAFDASGTGQNRSGAAGTQLRAHGGSGDANVNVAGRNFGLPAPNFLQPLDTRESYATSWDRTVPNVATYFDSHQEPSFRFRERPRIGRGGRLCIDRMPIPANSAVELPTVVTVGKGLPNYLYPKEHLLDLIPKPLNHAAVSRHIESICIAAVKEDVDKASMPSAMDQEENDGHEVLVDANIWLDTDEQLWGEERYSLYLR